MASSTAVQVSAVAVLALLRSRSALGSPHRSLPPHVYATDDAVTRSPGSLPNATAADHDIRTDHVRHSYVGIVTVECGQFSTEETLQARTTDFQLDDSDQDDKKKKAEV